MRKFENKNQYKDYMAYMSVPMDQYRLAPIKPVETLVEKTISVIRKIWSKV